MFRDNFLQFVEEAQKAFPGEASNLEAAKARFDADGPGAIREFAEDCAGLIGKVMRRDESLLVDIGGTRLFAGFRVPGDALPANKVVVMDYLTPLATIAMAMDMMPEGSMERLDGVLQNAAVMQSAGALEGRGSVGDILGSPAGQQLMGDVAKAMGFEIDLDDPMLRGMMGMLQMGM